MRSRGRSEKEDSFAGLLQLASADARRNQRRNSRQMSDPCARQPARPIGRRLPLPVLHRSHRAAAPASQSPITPSARRTKRSIHLGAKLLCITRRTSSISPLFCAARPIDGYSSPESHAGPIPRLPHPEPQGSEFDKGLDANSLISCRVCVCWASRGVGGCRAAQRARWEGSNAHAVTSAGGTAVRIMVTVGKKA